MLYTPATPPLISPVLPATDRPLWSVMIPVYNCAGFLAETLESVLAQRIPAEKMQIEVVDDASTDANVMELVRQIGKGRVKYYRQPHNVGSLRNFETCINRSRGKLVHLLHGDDKVKAGYYVKMEHLFENHPEAGAAFCRYSSIDEKGIKISLKTPEMRQDGILQNWLTTIGEKQLIQYAAITVRRETYEALGAFYGVHYGEDWEMWVRIARYFPVAYTPDILAEYRKHSDSITAKKFITGEHLADLHKTMMLIQEHLPEEGKKSILNRSKKYYARYALNESLKLWLKLHDEQLLRTQIKAALKFCSSPLLYMLAIKLLLIMKFSRT